MKFNYKQVSREIARPVIPIEVGYKDFFVSYEALVDSGADICIFDAEIGELLGIDIKAGEKKDVFGITGTSEPYYLHEVSLKVGGWPYKIKAGFLPKLGSHCSYGVVGQRGFFDIFIVKFDLIKNEIELKERK